MKDVAYYRTLPYHRIVRLVEEDGEVYSVAFVEELPALETDAPTREEALFRLDEMFDEYIRVQVEWGEEIPEPRPWPGTEGLPNEPEVMIGFTLKPAQPTDDSTAIPHPDWLKHQWRERGAESTSTVGTGS